MINDFQGGSGVIGRSGAIAPITLKFAAKATVSAQVDLKNLRFILATIKRTLAIYFILALELERKKYQNN